MKRKILLLNKKRHKRNIRIIKRLNRNLMSSIKFSKSYNNPFAILGVNQFEEFGIYLRKVHDLTYWVNGLPDSSPIRFKYGTPITSKRRCPNEREIIKERISILRRLYKSGEMSRNAYYTLKGLARKDPTNAENFIRKHNELDYNCLQIFKTTESILEFSIPVKSTNPVEIYTIDLNLKEEN